MNTMYNAFFKSSGVLTILVGVLLLHGCTDLPTGTEEQSEQFPSEKISLDGENLAEIEFYASQNDILVTEIITPGNGRENSGKGLRDRGDRQDGLQRGDQGRGRPGAGPVQSTLRALGALELTERQRLAVAGCLEAYEACVQSATTRARAVRSELHEDLVNKITRIRNAVADDNLGREEARALLIAALREYRESAILLSQRYRDALRTCITDLRECVEGVLTPEQLRKFRDLLEKPGGGDDTTDKDDDTDENEKREDRKKDKDGEKKKRDRGGDKDGDDDGDEGDDDDDGGE